MRERDFRNYGRQEEYERESGEGYSSEQRPERTWGHSREGGEDYPPRRGQSRESRETGWSSEGNGGRRGYGGQHEPYGGQSGYGYGGGQQGGSAGWGAQAPGGYGAGFGQYSPGGFVGGPYGQNYPSQYGGPTYGYSGYGTPGGYGGWEGYGPQQGYGSQGYGYGSSGWGGYGYGVRSGGHEHSWTEAIKSFFGKGPKDYKRSNDRIREDVSDRLTDHPGIDASEIVVIVEEAVVILDGTVENRQMKHMAEDVAESVSGVRDVDNKLRVARPTAQGRLGEGGQSEEQGRREGEGSHMISRNQ